MLVDIRVFGGLACELDGRAIELPRSRRARAVLGLLAVQPGPHPRARVAGLFWPEVAEASARASLRSAVWALRHALGPDAADAVVADRDSLRLRENRVWVDAGEFDHLVRAGRLEQAVQLCRGELLAEFDDDWVLTARDEHRARLTQALRGLGEQAEVAGMASTAVSWTRRRVGLDPLDEDAGRDLIRRLVQAEDIPGALAAYTRLVERLRTELGIAPSAATRQLAEQIRAQHPADVPTGALSPPPPRAGARHLAGRLVGRDDEVGLLIAAWEQALAGAGQAVLLSGDGGMGKTRLSTELVATARGDGAAVLAGGASVAAPFAPWAELLDDLVAELDRPPPDAGWPAILARLAPGLIDAADGTGAAGALALGRAAAAPEYERLRLFEAVFEALCWATRQRPVVLALEDLHLADPSTLELIAHLGRRIARLPLLMILTRRPVPPRAALTAALDALRARGALALELELAALPDAVAHQLARSTTGSVPATAPGASAHQGSTRGRPAPGSASSDAFDHLVAIADGNPLLIIELARAHARGHEDLAAGLRGAVATVLARLSPPARRLLELTAAAGRDLQPAELAELPLTDPAAAATETLGTGWMRAADGALGLRHALLAEAVYDHIADPLRARLHATLAEVLAAAGHRRGRGGGRGIRHAAEIAGHLRRAGHDEQAVAALARAARDARDLAALPDAAGFLRDALAIDPSDPELLVELAEIEAWRGRLDLSDTAFDTALAALPPGDTGALASAWLRRGRWLRGGICHPRESSRSYRAALDVLDRDPTAEHLARAEALAGLAWAEAVAGDPAATAALLAEVHQITGSHPPSDLLAHDTGVARGHALLRAGRFSDSYAPLVAAATAAGRAAHPDMAYSCLINAASAAACAGDFDRALQFAERSLALVVPAGLLPLAVQAHSARTNLLRRLDRLPEAHAACAAAAALADRADQPALDALIHHDRGLLALAAGDFDHAATELAAALERHGAFSRPLTRLHRAEALARAGHPDPAQHELRRLALEPVTSSDFPDTLVARMARVQGLIAIARHDLPLAEKRLREAHQRWQRRARPVGGSASSSAASDRGDHTPAGSELGAGYVTSLIDLGRPPITTLVEPHRELARLTTEIADLHQHIPDRPGRRHEPHEPTHRAPTPTSPTPTSPRR